MKELEISGHFANLNRNKSCLDPAKVQAKRRIPPRPHKRQLVFAQEGLKKMNIEHRTSNIEF